MLLNHLKGLQSLFAPATDTVNGQHMESDKLWYGAYHLRQYYRPEAVQVVLAQPTHKDPHTKIDLGLNNRGRRVLQNIDQLLLDRWKRCQKLVLLTAEQDIRHSPHVH
jgi:hypothetical protein